MVVQHMEMVDKVPFNMATTVEKAAAEVARRFNYLEQNW
jgi:hypothetical protein